MRVVFKFLALIIITIVQSCSSAEEELTDNNTIVMYELTVEAGEGGTVDSQGGTIASGKQISITATPNSEYVFVNWSNGSTNNPLSLTINSNQNITANFEKKKYPLTISIQGEGTVTEEIISTGKTTEYDSGTTVRLTAEPSQGWEFVGWSGAIESTDLEVQLLVSEAKTVSITFQMGNELAYLTEIRRVRSEINDIRRSDEGGASKVYSLDLENDNDLDMILLTNKPYQRDNDRFYIFKNNENKFEKIDTGLDLPVSNKCIIQDLNNDGLLDLFIPNYGLDLPPFPGGEDYYLTQNSNGEFEDVSSDLPHYGVKDLSHSAGFLDLSNDGDIDILVPLIFNDYLLIENTDQGLKEKTNSIIPTLRNFEINEENQTFFVPGSAPFNITEGNTTLYYYYTEPSALNFDNGDFNNDGYSDIIIGGNQSNTNGISDENNNLVFQVDPFGNKLNSSLKILFQNPETGELNYKYPEGIVPVNDFNGERLVDTILSDDLNKNGCEDIVVYSVNYSGGNQLEVILNQCNMIFESSQVFYLPPNIVSYWTILELLDIDNDGDLDIVGGESNQYGDQYLYETNHKVFINENGIFSERNGRTEDIQVLPPHIGINWYDPVQN
ncbi:VCBS repeat-containing protein [Flavobacteriaceae bacterium]|nr:VCBS repeat-containing protein [Flavobacteriaceae bacterium]